MKKILVPIAAAMLVSACATGTGTLGGTSGEGINAFTVIREGVKMQCRAELNQRNEWRLVALAMTAQKQAEVEEQICGCAADEAPNHLTAADMLSPRTAVANVTVKTVTTCVGKVLKK